MDSSKKYEPHDLGPLAESQPRPVPNQSHPPVPDGGYGWVCAVTVAIVNGHSWGINAAYSVFLAYYLKHNIFTGATHLQYAFVGSVSISCTLLISPLATIAVREFGTKPTMFLGALLQSVSLICASISTAIWHLFLSQGVLFGIGMGLLFIPSYGIVAQWFTERRALANGIAIGGAGIGGLVYSLSSEAMIRNMGLNWAFRNLSMITFVVNVICILFIRDRNKEIGSRQLALDIALLKRLDYLLILAFGSFSMLGYFVLIFTLANYGNEIGLDSSQAAVIPALFMLGQAVGRPFIGYFSDTIGRINMTALATLLTGVVTLVVWVNAKTYGTLIFFALIEGIVAGAFWVTVSPVMAEVIGLQNLPSGLSLMWLVLVIPSTFSEPIALTIVVRTGHYIGAQLFTGLMFVAAAICMATLRWWTINHLEGEVEASSLSVTRNGTEKSPRSIAMPAFKGFRFKHV